MQTNKLKTVLNQNPLMDTVRDFYWIGAYDKLSRMLATLDFDSKSETYRSNDETKYWTLWLQGRDNAPDIVKLCMASMSEKLGPQLEILNFDSAIDKAQLPSSIVELYLSNQIKDQRFSNLIRLHLLCRFGGTWLDSTVLLRKVPSHKSLGMLYRPNPFFGRTMDIGPNWYLTGMDSHFFHHLLHALTHVTEVTRGRGVSRRDMFLISGILMNQCQSCLLELDSQPIVAKERYKSVQIALLKNDEANLRRAWYSAPFHKLSHKQFEYSKTQMQLLEKLSSSN